MRKIYTSNFGDANPSTWSYKGYKVIGVDPYDSGLYQGSGKLAYHGYEIVGIKQKFAYLKLVKEVIDMLVEKKKTGKVNNWWETLALNGRKLPQDFFENLAWCEKDNRYVCPVFLAQQQRAKEILEEWKAKREAKKELNTGQ
jgi:hypothetical protein